MRQYHADFRVVHYGRRNNVRGNSLCKRGVRKFLYSQDWTKVTCPRCHAARSEK
jgi:hypothetical protein